MAKTIDVEIDGMMTPVDEREWKDDPDAVIALVRHNREAVDMRSGRFDDEADGILGNGR
jgi:hypothetical protein